MSNFHKVVELLDNEGIPANVKEKDNSEVIIELGMWYPDEIAERVFEALGDIEADVCAESSGGTVTKTLRTNGGKKRWN